MVSQIDMVSALTEHPDHLTRLLITEKERAFELQSTVTLEGLSVAYTPDLAV